MQWYFDVISPYAYLQSVQLPELNRHRAVECVPVLFAGLLGHWGQLGPAEIRPKRSWTFRDALWLARRDGVELNLPEIHPFNPLPLLRLSIVLNNEIKVVQRLFRYVWVDGHSPQNESAFDELLAELGVSRHALAAEPVKQQLLKNGKLALDAEVFGVPTLVAENELFWGHSATDMALAYLQRDSNPEAWPADSLTAVDQFPEGQGRSPSTQKAGPKPAPVKSATSKATRLPYLPIDLKEPADLVAAVRERRGGTLLELDRLLLYSTPLAEGWNHMLGNIRTRFSVEPRMRELAMCTVAVINGADYELSQHAPLYVKAGGSEEKVQLLQDPVAALSNRQFDKHEQAAIALTLEMTRDVSVSDACFANAKALFSDEHLVELVATVAAYNMVSRFLVALNVHP